MILYRIHKLINKSSHYFFNWLFQPSELIVELKHFIVDKLIVSMTAISLRNIYFPINIDIELFKRKMQII